MRVAAIDLGSNSLRLLIGETDGEKIDVLQEFVRSPQAGTGVWETKQINAVAMIRIIELLRRCRGFWTELEVEKVAGVATAFSREAKNWPYLAQSIMREVGIEFHSIDEKEEAELAFLGATSDLKDPSKVLLIDMGGGSTEFIYRKNELQVTSTPIGALTLKEQFLKSDPPAPKEIAALRKSAEEKLSNITLSASFSQVVAVGGTFTTLACLIQGIQFYDVEKVDNFHLKRPDLQAQIKTFSKERKSDLANRIPWDRLRAEILPAGAILCDQIMAHLKQKEIIVRHRGLVHGLALKAASA